MRKCVEKATGKEYACKIMEFNDDNDEERAATLREIQILKLVGGHPNIIDIIASFETPNYVFIVMELCPYGELFDYLTKVVRLSGVFFIILINLERFFCAIYRKTYSSNNVKHINWCSSFTFSSSCSSRFKT